ncbi:amidase family protein [Bradyrhizobium sp. 184]|uniref:amidase family protein n=1 Tax=Bradyrhizobium sp. 184 TaxID=2782653 RepID=UPI0035300F98
MPLSFSLDNVGPLARTARDCARVLSVIAGHDPLDPTSSSEKVPDYEAALDGEIGDLKIGVPTTYFLDDADQPVALAFEQAVRVLAKCGATVRGIAHLSSLTRSIHTPAS